jgi:hypothetical protein
MRPCMIDHTHGHLTLQDPRSQAIHETSSRIYDNQLEQLEKPAGGGGHLPRDTDAAASSISPQISSTSKHLQPSNKTSTGDVQTPGPLKPSANEQELNDDRGRRWALPWIARRRRRPPARRRRRRRRPSPDGEGAASGSEAGVGRAACC